MPQFTAEDIKDAKRNDQTLLVKNGKVFDISNFINIHPGGKEIVMKYHGKDVSRIMEKGTHKHSENAYRWLDQHYVGDLVNEKDENANEEIAEEPDLVNWSKPVLWQVGHLGAKYHDWVDAPVDRPLRLFKSDFVEYFSSTNWYVIPMFWLPIIAMILVSTFCSYKEVVFFQTLPFISFSCSNMAMIPCFVLGIFTWTFLEYALHRWLFHANPPVSSYWLITLHFLLHGQHHKVPFDKGRLVFPVVPAFIMAVMLYALMSVFLDTPIRHAVFAGILAGYLAYDLTHYYLHYGSPSKGSYFYNLRAYHVRHHFQNPELGFGISSRLWDYPFNTLLTKVGKSD